MPFVPKWEHPIRIPATLTPSFAEPPVAVVGEVGTWRMAFHLPRGIAVEEELRRQLYGGRNNYGSFTPTDENEWLTAETDDGHSLPISPIPLQGQRLQEGTFTLAVPDGGLPAGATIIVTVGLKGDARVWDRCVRNKFALLYVSGLDGDGATWTEADGIVAACLMHIIGGPVDHLYVYAPSQARPGDPLMITVRPQTES